MRNWRILDYGKVPQDARKLDFTCPHCERDSALPHVGTPMAQIGAGIVFNPGEHAMPAKIQCPYCRRKFSQED